MKRPCVKCGRECDESAGRYIAKRGRGGKPVKRWYCDRCAGMSARVTSDGGRVS